MPVAQLRYQPQGAVLEAFGKSRKPFRFLRGPLGGGKTIATAFRVFKYLCEQKPNKEGVRKSRWAVVRNTYPDLTNTTIRDWRSIVPDGCGSMTFGHPPEMKLDFDLPDGTRVQAEVIFVALDKPDDVRKLRGMQLTGAWINEAKEVPRAIFDMLTGRIDRYPAPGFSTWVGILGDTNAWDADHYLEVWAQAVRNGEMADYEFFVQPPAVVKVDGKWTVNPAAENLAVLKPDYYARQIAGKREDWIKVNLANEIGYYVDGRAVHPEYSDSLHGAKEILVPTPGIVYVGLDFGLTPAAAFMQRQANGQWWAFDEIATEDGDASTLAIECKAREQEWNARVGQGARLTFVYRGDPSGDNRVQTDSDTAFKVMRANGVMAFPCSTNDPQLRRDALDRPLTRTVKGLPGLQISPRCKMLRKGLAGAFCYRRVAIAGDERFRDVPDKNIFSHVCEAAEYALLDAGEHAVKDGGRNAPAPRPVRLQPAWSPFDA